MPAEAADRWRTLRPLLIGAWPRWIGRFAERAGGWVALLALAAVPVARGDYATAAALVATRLGVRPLLLLLFDERVLARLRRVPEAAYVAALTATAAEVALLAISGSTFSVAADVGPLIGSAALLGLFSALADLAHDETLRRRAGTAPLDAGGRLEALVDAAAMALAPIPGMAVATGSVAAAAAIAALLLALATLALTVEYRAVPSTPAGGPSAAAPRGVAAAGRHTWPYHVAAFASGALAAALLSLWLFDPGPALLALVGLGLLAGRVPVPRLLLRVSAPLVVLATSVVAALVIAAVLATAQPWSGQAMWALAGAAVIVGLVGAAQTRVCQVALRRLAPPGGYAAIARMSGLALGIGQIVGAVAVVHWAPSVGAAGVVAVVAVGQAALVAVAVVLGGRSALAPGGLSSLPIRTVVHALSWAADPPATAADFSGQSARVARLVRWLNRHVTLEFVHARLPVSGREYTIARPTDVSRERLFAAGRADPEKQMPYWAKVWPSGVALADVVIERAAEVAGRHVLELGAGLGVTACAVLEAGGRLVTADYAALPLAHCRLNSLLNTGRVPRAMCFNWRHVAEVDAAAAMPELRGGFPLIIAADVLYEGRDAEPLLAVIERLLTADGQLWLAEPVRRTAQRFLDTAAERGWQIVSRQVRARWPDATDGPVNLHFLVRSEVPDRIPANLGGWRI